MRVLQVLAIIAASVAALFDATVVEDIGPTALVVLAMPVVITSVIFVASSSRVGPLVTVAGVLTFVLLIFVTLPSTGLLFIPSWLLTIASAVVASVFLKR